MRDVNELLHHVCISLRNSLRRVAGNGEISILMLLRVKCHSVQFYNRHGAKLNEIASRNSGEAVHAKRQLHNLPINPPSYIINVVDERDTEEERRAIRKSELRNEKIGMIFHSVPRR